MTISQPNPSVRPTGAEPGEFLDPEAPLVPEDTTGERVEAMPEQPEVMVATEEADVLEERQDVPVNIYETPEALVVVAPLPAVRPEDVVIEVRPGALRVEASVRSAGPREYLVHEWSYGGYEREVEIPAEFGSGVSASLGNGQLAVRIERGEARTMRIRPSSH